MHVTVPHQRRFNNNQHVITGGCICNNTWPSIAMLRTLGTIPPHFFSMQYIRAVTQARVTRQKYYRYTLAETSSHHILPCVDSMQPHQ